jgi:hypothetical protein
MSELRLKMMMSLDGFTAGPHQSAENPFGIGGMQLNEWLFPLSAFREMQGEEGGEVNASTPIVEGSDNLGDARPRLEQVQVVEAPGVTHIRYRVR